MPDEEHYESRLVGSWSLPSLKVVVRWTCRTCSTGLIDASFQGSGCGIDIRQTPLQCIIANAVAERREGLCCPYTATVRWSQSRCTVMILAITQRDSANVKWQVVQARLTCPLRCHVALPSRLVGSHVFWIHVHKDECL